MCGDGECTLLACISLFIYIFCAFSQLKKKAEGKEYEKRLFDSSNSHEGTKKEQQQKKNFKL